MNMPAARPLSETIAAESESPELGLREILGMIVAGRLVLGLTTLLFVLAGLLYLWVATPIYKSDGLIQVEQKQDSIKAALGESMPWFGGQVPISAEIEIIRSRMVVEKVVDALGFEIGAGPHYFPLIGQGKARRWQGPEVAPPVLGLSGYAWGGEILRVSALEVPKAMLSKPLQLIATESGFELNSQDGDRLLEGLVGQRATGQWGSEPVSIFVTELRARPGTRFKVIRHHRSEVIAGLQKAVRIAEKGRQSGVLGITYEGSDPQQVARVVHELATAYQKQNVGRKSAEAAQTLTFLETQQLPELRARLEATEAELNRFRLQRGSADLTKETELILQQSVALERTRMELLQKREELRQRFTGQHPTLVGLEAQLRQLDESHGEIATQVKKLPTTQQDLLRLTRDVQVNNALYTALLNSAQELQVVKAGTVGNVRIIDFPEVAIRRSRPQSGLTLLLAIFLGLLSGVIATFLLHALRDGVYDPAEVEKALGLATYAAIPYSSEQKRLGSAGARKKGGQILALAHPDSIATESFRSFRTALHFALIEAPNNVIMLSGPDAGLGKSFVTVNLAAVLATAGKRVLVIDADLRRGHAHEMLGLPNAPGLSNYIAGNADLDAVIQRSSVENLSFVARGPAPPNPAELLLHPRLADLLSAVSQRYDHVLVDSPPILAVTDAAVIGKFAGSTLLILKAGAHSMRAIGESLLRFQRAGIPIRGTVFNQIGVHGTRRYDHAYDYRKKAD